MVIRSISPFKVHQSVSPVFITVFATVGVLVVSNRAVSSFNVWEGAQPSGVLDAMADTAAVEISAGKAGVLAHESIGLGG